MITYPLDKIIPYNLGHPVYKSFDLLKPHFPNLMLAGGGLRDIIFNKPVKEFGFFYFHGDEKLNTSYLFDQVVPEVLNCEHCRKEDDGLNFNIFRQQAMSFVNQNNEILEFNYAGQPFLETIKAFYLSINQIWYDGKEIRISDSFLKTYQTKEVVLFEKDFLASSHFVRGLEKLQARFPEFDFTKILQKKPKAKKSSGVYISSSTSTLYKQIIEELQPIGIHALPIDDPQV